MENESKPDFLRHEELAEEICRRLTSIPDGSVISVEAPWGRGKTDLLRRLYEKQSREHRVWVDPWLRRESLIVETVCALRSSRKNGTLTDSEINRVEQLLACTKGLSSLATLIGVATNPAVGLAVKATSALGASALTGVNAVKEFLNLTAEGKKIDPAKAFAEIVDSILGSSDQARLLFFIDDMDRCTPAEQVAILEELHLLTIEGPRAYFLVAVDSNILSRALESHYGTGFDGHHYLDKIFKLRLHLYQMDEADIEELLKPEQVGFLTANTAQAVLPHVVKSFKKLGQRCTPRLIERVLTKASFAFVPTDIERSTEDLKMTLTWLAYSEAFPKRRRRWIHLASTHHPAEAFRKLLQDSDSSTDRAFARLLLRSTQDHSQRNTDDTDCRSTAEKLHKVERRLQRFASEGTRRIDLT